MKLRRFDSPKARLGRRRRQMAVFAIASDPVMRGPEPPSRRFDAPWRRAGGRTAAHLNSPKYRPLIVENMEKGDYRIIPTRLTYANEIAIKLNLTHRDPVKREVFQNKNFRIGLSHAIDRQAIIDTVFSGVGEPANISPLPDSGVYRESMAKQYLEYDVDLANQFLDEAGYAERDSRGIRLGPDGKPIRIAFEVIAGFVDPGELIANNWRAVGIDAQFSEMERSLRMTQIFANEHDVVLWSGDGGTRGDLYLNPRIYLPTSPFESEHATRWALWYDNPDAPEAMVPPDSVQRQYQLYDEFNSAATEAEQKRLMDSHLPHPFARPDGCTFHPRCASFMPGECDRTVPSAVTLPSGTSMRCLLYSQENC